MTETQRAAMQQALEALEYLETGDIDPHPPARVAISALRAALAEPAQDHFPDATKMVQKPVAWRFKPMIGWPWSLSDDGYYISCKRDQGYFVEPLYTTPPQRPAEPVQEQPVCDECGKHKRDGWALYCVDCVEPVFALSQPPDSKHAKEKA